VQRRVGGAFGHLSNQQAAGLLERIQHRGLRRVLLAHISMQNNRPELAVGAIRGVMSGLEPELADQERGSGWMEI
jgi:phosphoribosyl 1,2-cyclic phosphodiesterase